MSHKYRVMALDLCYQDIMCIYCTELNLCGGVSCMPAALLLCLSISVLPRLNGLCGRHIVVVHAIIYVMQNPSS